MTVQEIKKELMQPKYDFLRNDSNLGQNIILLGLGGSHAYGTNNAGSDVDIRGIATNSKRNILTGNDFEQVVEVETDTTIYSLAKIIKLLCSCNPNTIEMLGLKPDHYLYVSDAGQMLLDNRHLFLSQKAAHAFGGYASQQLYRLNQKAAHHMSHQELEKHILNTLRMIQETFHDRYSPFPSDGIKLYIDQTSREKYDTEIFMDVNLSHYPVRDYCSLWSELQTTTKQYSKIGKRNEKALEHNKIAKHMMHLIRLYYMCFDILENEEIVTYRTAEHDFLMSIRNGQFIDADNQPTAEFYHIVDELEKRLEYAQQNTSLPVEPDYAKIYDMMFAINNSVVGG